MSALEQTRSEPANVITPGPDLRRAGFWRRIGASFIDGFVVVIVLQIVGLIVEGVVTKTVQVVFILDLDGKPIHGSPLDVLLLPALLLMRWWSDRDRGSLGRRSTGIGLVSLSNINSAPPLAALNKRYAAQALPWLPTYVAISYTTVFSSLAFADSIWIWSVVGASVCAAVPGLAALIAVVCRKDAYYDRFAGTAVVRKLRTSTVDETARPEATSA